MDLGHDVTGCVLSSSPRTHPQFCAISFDFRRVDLLLHHPDGMPLPGVIGASPSREEAESTVPLQSCWGRSCFAALVTELSRCLHQKTLNIVRTLFVLSIRRLEHASVDQSQQEKTAGGQRLVRQCEIPPYSQIRSSSAVSDTSSLSHIH